MGILTLVTQGQSIRVATYNIRFDNPGDSLDAWPYRYKAVAGLIRFNDFEIFGTQEGLRHQLEDLKNELPGFDYVGVGRDDGDKKGEHAAIFYHTERFRLLSGGNFWLSPVTDKPNKGWDAALPRICTWGRFQVTATGKEFYVFNVHFDHRGVVARKESASLVLQMMKSIAGSTPAILTGDFNFDEKHASYHMLNTSGYIRDVYELTDIRYAPEGTFNGFKLQPGQAGRIDHIFITPGFLPVRYGILTNTFNGRYPSDHFPVFTELSY
jgi:endonuclease/exonuclease/phosphatase family metal-dependent hydrolase